MEAPPSGLRKGAWTAEEDSLLKQCTDEYGEGKWHQVPLRAGLSRCRKSCRLRWLNYLKPDIKRGIFNCDEVDLILRLHKLLGNRWALIAGRIPGRTANDIKNYWNTNLSKKKDMSCKNKMVERNPTCLEAIPPSKIDVIKPQPHYFLNSRSFSHFNGLPEVDLSGIISTDDYIPCNINIVSDDINACNKNEENYGNGMDGEVPWWESLQEEIREADAMDSEAMAIDEAGTSLMNSSPSVVDYEQLWSAFNTETGKLD